jgi:hypothetical protein
VTGTVSLDGDAPKAGITVKLSSANSKYLTVPASVKIPAGASSTTFAVTHKLVPGTTNVGISATVGSITVTTTATLQPFQITALSLTPSSLAGGAKLSGLITLNATPGKGSSVIAKLTSSSKSVVVPASVTFLVGSSQSFTATTSAVTAQTTATVTATLGSSSSQASVTLIPASLASVSVSPSSYQGGGKAVVTGTVTLTGMAPAGGLKVTLASTNASAAGVPANVTIPAGKSSATFKVTHAKVTSQTNVTITGSLAAVNQTATVTVTP